jgi:hypothetical protein
MSVKSTPGLVLYCYLSMPTINKTYLILSYLNIKEVAFNGINLIFYKIINISNYTAIPDNMIVIFYNTQIFTYLHMIFTSWVK